MVEARDRLVFPLDYASRDEALAGARRVAPAAGVLKVGLELFTREGPSVVSAVAALGRDVFLDLKLCDLPATVGAAVASVASLGVRYLTVHASGGRAMLERAVEAAGRAAQPITILAVTVLTSLDAADLAAQGIAGSPAEHALRLARLAHDAGVRGFVCSPAEARALRAALGAGVTLVTPGIRPAGAAIGDQKRVATPATAIADGADLLVVGRPIRDAADPLAAARAVVAEIEAAARARTDAPR
ncbi:MAG TPA: orotidine-5'-phosphate decarboxylase [Minicystis sp.]|nr:orotidine-5'-phosphate decarboxylase [Minicystis sp.]